jgi:hypothetical protein
MKNIVYQLEIGPYKQIGSTNNVKRRLSEHSSLLKLGRHPNKLMQGAYNKYQSLMYTILGTFATREEAYKYEQVLLDQYYKTSGYLMMSNNATGYMSGESHPNKKDGFRLAQSNRMKINNPSLNAVTKARQISSLKEYYKNNFVDNSHLQKQEIKEKRVKSIRQYYKENPKQQTGSDNPNAKKILNVETGEIYATGKEAAAALGYKAAWISTLAKRGKKLRFI